ncbi:MAG: LCP family protein [Eggerthellaceae bacterium]
MALNNDTNKRRPSAGNEKRDRNEALAGGKSEADSREAVRSEGAVEGTQRIAHVAIPLDQIRREHEAARRARSEASTDEDRSAASSGEGDPARVGDAVLEGVGGTVSEGKPANAAPKGRESVASLTPDQAIVAFAAASAREVPAPKQKKRIPASLLKGLFSAASGLPGEDDSIEMIAYDEKVLKQTAAAMGGEEADDGKVGDGRGDSRLFRRPAAKRAREKGEAEEGEEKPARGFGFLHRTESDRPSADRGSQEGEGGSAVPPIPESEGAEGTSSVSSDEPAGARHEGDASVAVPEIYPARDGSGSGSASGSDSGEGTPSPEAVTSSEGEKEGANLFDRDSVLPSEGAVDAPETAAGDGRETPEGDSQESPASERPRISERKRGASRGAKPKKKIDRKKLHRGIGIAAAVLALALAAAIAVACFVFGAPMTKDITLEDDALSEVLVPAEQDGEPFYTLVAVEYNRTSRYYEGPGLLVLLRIDPANRIATLISVPSETQVSLSDSRYHSVSEAQIIGGDAYLIESVAQLLNVDIAHFVRTDDTGLANIVDRFGGIEVEVVADAPVSENGEDADPYSVDAGLVGEGASDADQADGGEAGDAGIAAGKQTLDGESTVALTSEGGYAEDPVGIQSQNQLNVVSALLDKCIQSSGKDYSSTLSDLKNDFKTDMTAAQLRSVLRLLAGEEGYKTYTATMPGEYDPLTETYQRDKTATRLMMVGTEENGNPGDRDESKIDKASVYIEVQNGTNIEGGASDVRKKLRDKGWNVSFIGNNPNEDEPKTLVIYGDESMKAAAEEVASDLGVGKVSSGEEGYTFGTDILVVIGLDWDKPAAQEDQQAEG